MVFLNIRTAASNPLIFGTNTGYEIVSCFSILLNTFELSLNCGIHFGLTKLKGKKIKMMRKIKRNRNDKKKQTFAFDIEFTLLSRKHSIEVVLHKPKNSNFTW